ncbi:MAG: DUF1611 domain-containing protein [Paenibacillus macerans]|uniref:D-glutamate N-acetyltransferase-like C-terminal domain-containing protein n=1 Tax=Paenibacillus macerans TaxID=44252 RepID=A0A090ZMQ6_PAEMA|nr:DUF1611 domain-containing protein [Paenibacillus macerans]KFN11693.1 hypothetical protein DJ90_6441 [Paenibacillus macerans]MBS5913692.1 DUF1611 domain-containing protein [Paenibacillus macerans]MCY7561482.1 DUF1611 domain-containing protein [Paenibacillus macerans]MDU5945840.1 DUF1611 domain-containing protein [Paenibacillus macerans]MDU7476240.1 DUF1611 domain-containing protein [Paenibacillus macerans]
MKKVALYPYNKITQGIVRFRDLTDFSIQAVIDFVVHRGEDVGQVMEGKPYGIPITDNLEQALGSVSTLILNDPGTAFGNNEGVYSRYNLKDLWKLLVQTAYENNIRVVSVHEIIDQDTLAWLKEKQINIHVDPQIPASLEQRLDEEYAIPPNDEVSVYLNYFALDHKILNFNRNICKIGIFATRGCLGKFTTQMTLLRELRRLGQKTKAMITEPTATLFNQPGGDIMKFIAKRRLAQYPYYIHAAVREAELAGNDFFLLAGQGSLLPNENFVIASTKVSYLRAFQPDAALLIAGYDDDEQIRDCMDLLRIYGNGSRPFALLIPNKVEVGYDKYLVKTEEEISLRKEQLKRKFGIEHVECVLDAHKLAGPLIQFRALSEAKSR